MVAKTAVVLGEFPTTVGGTVDITVPGFGTPQAAIVVVSGARSGTNPDTAYANLGVGFWTPSNQRSVSAYHDGSTATTNGGRYVSLDQVMVGFPIDASATGITDGIRITNLELDTTAARYIQVTLIAGVANAHAGHQTFSEDVLSYDYTSAGFEADLAIFGSNCNGIFREQLQRDFHNGRSPIARGSEE